MKFKIAVACMLGAFAAPAAFASGDIDVAGLIQPGLYEVTSQMTMKDMGTLPAQTATHCVTPDDVKDFAGNLANQLRKSNGQVHVTDLSLKNKDLHFTVTTPQGDMTFDIVFDDPTHYHQTMAGVVAGHAMTAQSKGHRVGDCKAPAPK